MITPAYYEDAMKMNEENKNKKAAIKDTIIVLKQYGFDSGADILERMMNYEDEILFARS